MIIIDPITRQRVLSMPGVGDITYNLNGDASIANEDVPLTGNWQDYTGSSNTASIPNVNSKTQQLWAGTENELQGTDPDIESKEDLNKLTVRGNKANTTRSRIIKRYVKFDNGNKDFS